MPLAEAPMAVLATALRDPNVVIRYQAKIVTVPGSDCLWWQGAVSGRGHGRFYVATVVADLGGGDRDLCVIAHRFGYALIYGSAALNAVPVLGHGLRQSLVSADRPWPRQAVLARAEPPRLPGAAVLGGQPVGGCPAGSGQVRGVTWKNPPSRSSCPRSVPATST